MQHRTLTSTILLGLASLAVSGCGGGAQTVTPSTDSRESQSVSLPQSNASRIVLPEDVGRMRGIPEPAKRSWMSPEVKQGGPLVYVLEYSCSCVYVYPLKGKDQEPIGQIAGLAAFGYGPDFIGMGNDGYVWISLSNQTVLGYARGATSPSVTLSDPGSYYPEHIAVDDAGTIYVGNFVSSGSGGNVVLYQNGATSPTQTLSDPSVTSVIGVAVDKNHDVFVNAQNAANQRFIGEFVAGASGSYTFQQLVAGQNPSQLYQGLQLDSTGNLLVSSQGPLSIEVLSPPSWDMTAELGGNAGTTDIAFNSTWTRLFTPYLNNRAVVEFAYPSGKQVNELIAGLYNPASVAVDPKPPLSP